MNKFQIAICGSAQVTDPKVAEQAEIIGSYIAKSGHILISGATTGYPWHAAKGAKQAGGLSFGISPATGRQEHAQQNRPFEYFDAITYTGFGATGRNVIIIRSGDAVIFVGGRIGTVNEFTAAYEANRVLGVLKGSSPNADLLPQIATQSGRPGGVVIYKENPEILVQKVIEELEKH